MQFIPLIAALSLLFSVQLLFNTCFNTRDLFYFEVARFCFSLVSYHALVLFGPDNHRMCHMHAPLKLKHSLMIGITTILRQVRCSVHERAAAERPAHLGIPRVSSVASRLLSCADSRQNPCAKNGRHSWCMGSGETRCNWGIARRDGADCSSPNICGPHWGVRSLEGCRTRVGWGARERAANEANLHLGDRTQAPFPLRCSIEIHRPLPRMSCKVSVSTGPNSEDRSGRPTLWPHAAKHTNSL